MKNLKNIFLAFALIAFTGSYAQKINKQVENESVVRTFEIESENKTVSYSVKVDTKKMNYVTMEDSELKQKEQTRVLKPKKVMKLISVSSEMNPAFNNVFELWYMAKGDEEIKVYPTSEGFTLDVNGKAFTYRLLDRDYVVSKKNADFFQVKMQDAK